MLIFSFQFSYLGKSHLTGVYQITQNNQTFILNFTERNEFWVFVRTESNGNRQLRKYTGNYRRISRNYFIIEGDEVEGFETFSILNRNLDILLTKDGVKYQLTKISSYPGLIFY